MCSGSPSSAPRSSSPSACSRSTASVSGSPSPASTRALSASTSRPRSTPAAPPVAWPSMSPSSPAAPLGNPPSSAWASCPTSPPASSSSSSAPFPPNSRSPPGRRPHRPPEDHGVDPLRHRRTLHRPGLGWLKFITTQGLVYQQWSRHQPGLVGHGCRHPHRRHRVPHVARRADRQARHRQRRLHDHHGRHPHRHAQRHHFVYNNFEPGDPAKSAGWASCSSSPASSLLSPARSS
jgi:hypothetical protein